MNERSTQDKFMARMRQLADAREGIELIVDANYANTGRISFERQGSFQPVLQFPYSFSRGRGSFNSGSLESDPLGPNDRGGRWSAVEGEEFDKLIIRIEEVLDGHRAA